MIFHIISCAAHEFWVVPKQTYSLVALRTKNSPYPATSVAVVNVSIEL